MINQPNFKEAKSIKVLEEMINDQNSLQNILKDHFYNIQHKLNQFVELAIKNKGFNLDDIKMGLIKGEIISVVNSPVKTLIIEGIKVCIFTDPELMREGETYKAEFKFQEL